MMAQDNRPTAQDVPAHIMIQIARSISDVIDDFYADPENEAAFQRWKAEKEAARA